MFLTGQTAFQMSSEGFGTSEQVGCKLEEEAWCARLSHGSGDTHLFIRNRTTQLVLLGDSDPIGSSSRVAMCVRFCAAATAASFPTLARYRRYMMKLGLFLVPQPNSDSSETGYCRAGVFWSRNPYIWRSGRTLSMHLNNS